MTANPVLVEVHRGERVESRHRAAVAVVDADGGRLLTLGDVAARVFPRSAVKIVQALPLVESGAADALGFGAAELALAVASHNGEPLHVETAATMLARVGRTEVDLECGAHWPNRQDDIGRLHRAGLKPGALHNNCSGKHAGFVCLACHTGVDPAGYVAPEHPVQQAIVAAMTDVFATTLGPEHRGTDGCAIPTWAMPLENLAAGMARLATGRGLAPERARAGRRLMDAAMAEPFMVAGTGRFCTDFMTRLAGRVFVKTGAEGVFCGAVPSLGLGIAIKCDDGAGRAAEAVMARVVAELLGLDGDPDLESFVAPTLTNWNRQIVGRIETTSILTLRNPRAG